MPARRLFTSAHRAQMLISLALSSRQRHGLGLPLAEHETVGIADFACEAHRVVETIANLFGFMGIGAEADGNAALAGQ